MLRKKNWEGNGEEGKREMKNRRKIGKAEKNMEKIRKNEREKLGKESLLGVYDG